MVTVQEVPCRGCLLNSYNTGGEILRDASEVTTEKLYEEDAYMSSFVGKIVSVNVENDTADLVLDRTAFFPEEGGQSPDHGSLGKYSVVDVQIRDGEIHHRLDTGKADPKDVKKDLAVGNMIEGALDFYERFSNMQQHSGEHLFSGIAHRLYGVENVGFHLSPNEVTLDFDKALTEEQLQLVELKANEAVFANVETEVICPDPKEREGIDYRSKLDLPGKVRIVIFPGYDACACCAPHVKRSGEIGLIKLVSFMKWKKGVRVNILCGSRAVAYMQKEHSAAVKTARFLSVGIEDLEATVRRRQAAIEDMKSELRELSEQLLDARAGSPSDYAGKPVILFADAMDINAVRSAINKVAAKGALYCAVFMQKAPDTWNCCIGSTKADTREVFQLLKDAFGARGGGKPEMVQGSLSAKEREIRKTLQSFPCNSERGLI